MSGFSGSSGASRNRDSCGLIFLIGVFLFIISPTWFEAENDAAAQAVLARAVTGSADGTQVLRFGELTPSLAQIFKEVVK